MHGFLSLHSENQCRLPSSTPSFFPDMHNAIESGPDPCHPHGPVKWDLWVLKTVGDCTTYFITKTLTISSAAGLPTLYGNVVVLQSVAVRSHFFAQARGSTDFSTQEPLGVSQTAQRQRSVLSHASEQLCVNFVRKHTGFVCHFCFCCVR